MGDRVEGRDTLFGALSGENTSGEAGTIEGTVFTDQVSSEARCDLLERGLTRLENLPSDSVGVRRRRPHRGEHAGDRGLAGSDTAADCDDAGGALHAQRRDRTDERGRTSPAAQSTVHSHRVTSQHLRIGALMQELVLLKNPHHQVSISDADSQ